MADIAHEHQAASGQAVLGSVRVGEMLVTRQLAGQRLAALLEALLQIAADHAEPIAIGGELVLGIDRRDRILAIGDGGQCGFEHDVGDICRIGAADRMRGIEHDFDMQAVMAEEA